MPRLIWTPEALRDLARSHAFLAPLNRSAARRAVAAVKSGVRLLSYHPEIGRMIDDGTSGFREWPIGFGSGGYVALYRWDGQRVIVLAIRHGLEAGF